MLQILIPIAGPNIFFDKEEYPYPKPLIEIDGVPMIEHVVENMLVNFPDAKLFFILKIEDCIKYHLDNVIRVLTDNKAEIVQLTGDTKGAVCSCLMAIEKLDPEQPLLICNGDQVIDAGLKEGIQQFTGQSQDAGVLTFKAVHPKWSYIRTEGTKVIETTEKNPISNKAIAGIYYYKKASFFTEAAFQTILNNDNLNGLFYISSTLNELILINKSVGYYELKNENYHSFYSPDKIHQYEKRVNAKA